MALVVCLLLPALVWFVNSMWLVVFICVFVGGWLDLIVFVAFVGCLGCWFVSYLFVALFVLCCYWITFCVWLLLCLLVLYVMLWAWLVSYWNWWFDYG